MDLRKGLRYGIWALLFVTPFLVNFVADSMFFPFITGKNFTFRILVELATALWALLMLVDKESRPRKSWVLIGTSAFIGALFLADIFGVNPERSLWSNFERMEGFVCLAHLYLYFLILGCTISSEKVWGWFANTWLVSSAFIFIAAVRQVLDTSATGLRVDAGLGNSAYMGIYAVFNVFLASLLWVRTDKRLWWRYFYPLIGLANLYLVFMSQTRGSLVGLALGVFVTVGIYAFFVRERPELRRYASFVLVALLLCSGALFATRHTKFVQGIPGLGRVANISLSGDDTGSIRLKVWGISWHGFLERPVLGWGQDNFLYVFGGSHYDPRMYKYEPWYDRSHDVFFDWLIAGGAVGLLTYLSLYVATLYYLWFYKKGELFSLSEKAIVTGMLVAYFIHNVFVFDNLVSYMFFFAFLGWMQSRVTALSPEESAALAKGKKGGLDLDGGDLVIAGAVIFAVTGLAIYFVNYRDIDANMTMLTAIRGGSGALYVDAGGKQRIALLDALDEARIGKTEVREQLIQQALQANAQQSLPKDIKDSYIAAARGEIEEVLKNDPLDLRMRTFAMAFYANLGEFQNAEKVFSEATTLSPKRGSLYLDFTNVRIQESNFPGALETASKAVELMPDNDHAHVAKASALILNGKTDDAKKELALVVDKKLYADRVLMYALGKTGGLSVIADVLRQADRAGGLDGMGELVYAEALGRTGNMTDAMAAVAKAKQLDPSLSDKADALIKSFTK